MLTQELKSTGNMPWNGAAFLKWKVCFFIDEQFPPKSEKNKLKDVIAEKDFNLQEIRFK